jgi:hypothetical protein
VNFCGDFLFMVLSNGMINVANTGKTSFMSIRKTSFFSAQIFSKLSCNQQLSVKESCTKFLGNLMWCSCWYKLMQGLIAMFLVLGNLFFTLQRYVKWFWCGYDSNFPCVANFLWLNANCVFFIFCCFLIFYWSHVILSSVCFFPLFPS